VLCAIGAAAEPVSLGMLAAWTNGVATEEVLSSPSVSWRRSAYAIGSRRRREFVDCLRALVPLVTTLGGEAALREIMAAADDVERWFP